MAHPPGFGTHALPNRVNKAAAIRMVERMDRPSKFMAQGAGFIEYDRGTNKANLFAQLLKHFPQDAGVEHLCRKWMQDTLLISEYGCDQLP